MVALKYLLSSLPLLLQAVSASDVIDLTPSNFDSIVLKSGKPALVEFFAPWCGHCKNLAPVYEELATAFARHSDKVTVAKVDADAHKDLGKKFGVQGFPTLKWFDGKSDKPEEYNGGRDLEALSDFITDRTSLKPRFAPKRPSDVVMLTDQTFKEQVGKEQDVLVAFTAPWCGHCKSLAPVWESLATDFSSEAGVLIAKVDAEAPNSKATAEEFGVKSYPTIKFFPKGSTTAEDYAGGRSEQDFVTFINEKAGTHRSAGGSLNEDAGKIDTLDKLVEAWASAPAQAALQKVIEEAGKLKVKYAEYYARVAKKTDQNAGYIMKELTRLQNILAKGGLAQSKLDDLISRTNILKVFQGEKEDDEDEEKSEL